MRVVVLLLLLAASIARAELPPPAAAAAEAAPSTRTGTHVDLRFAEYSNRYRSAHLRRNLGVGFAAMGLTAVAAGLALVAYGLYDIPPSTSYDASVTLILAGVASSAIGAVVGGVGAYLAIDGQNQMTEMQWRMGLISVAPRRDGFVVGFTTHF